MDMDDNKIMQPVRYADGLYYIGSASYPSWLIDCGEVLALLDTAMPSNYDSILENIKKLGYDIKNVKHILHSHGHIDHMGCTKAIAELTGAKTYVGYGDEDSAAGRNELQWTNEFGIEYTGAFEPDVIVCDGDVIEIGNKKFRFVATPGHTAGVMSIFFDVTDSGKTYLAGMFGGGGMNSLSRAYMTKYSLPFSLREDFKKGIMKIYDEPVEVHLGNHIQNANHAEKVALLGGRANPFVEKESWKELLDKKLKETEIYFD